MVVYWREHDRQVRVRGSLERLPAAASDTYFATRPRESRLGAWASPQSRPLPGRDALEESQREVEERWEGEEDIPRPEYWGWLLGVARDGRVLAGSEGPHARPLPLHARAGERLADRAPCALILH